MATQRPHPGVFITFEGPEGSGKTTQIHRLAAQLAAEGWPVLTTREPGGTAIGNAIRAVLLDLGHSTMTPRAEALLFNAARAQLVEEVLRPALAAGKVVLCDRYADSTLAYQGYGRGQDLASLAALAAFATGGLTPDLTVYLDVEPSLGLRRKQAGAAEEWNRLDDEALAFHTAVRQGYLQLMARQPARWFCVDASLPVDAIAGQVADRALAVCRSRTGEAGAGDLA